MPLSTHLPLGLDNSKGLLERQFVSFVLKVDHCGLRGLLEVLIQILCILFNGG